jgi:hypothetical protein
MRQACQLVGLTLGIFLLTSPYIVLDWPQFMADFNRQRQHMIDGHFLDLGIGWVYHMTFTLRYGLGLPLLIAGLAGMVLAITQRARAFWPVLIFGLAYYLWVGSTKTVFVRYAIPLVPVWITCGTFAVQQGVVWLTQRFPQQLQPRHTLPLTLALISAISLPTCISSLRYDWLLAQDDTRTLARNWFIAHLRPQESVGIGLALAHIDLPYRYNKYFLAPVESQHHFGDLNRNFIPSDKIVISDQPTQRHEFNITTYTNMAKLQGLGMRYFAIGHSPLTLFNIPPFEQEPITQQYRPIVRFNTTPKGHIGPTRFDYDQLDAYYVPYRNLWSVDRPGPDITIYAVPPAKS